MSEAIREFDCAQCKKHIIVIGKNDRRTRFCCSACEKKWWKRHNKEGTWRKPKKHEATRHPGRPAHSGKYHINGGDEPAGYDTLGLAVVIRAIEDYKTASVKLARGKRSYSELESAEREKNDCIRFFKSGWMLTLIDSDDLSGIDIKARLDEQIERELRRKGAAE